MTTDNNISGSLTHLLHYPNLSPFVSSLLIPPTSGPFSSFSSKSLQLFITETEDYRATPREVIISQELGCFNLIIIDDDIYETAEGFVLTFNSTTPVKPLTVSVLIRDDDSELRAKGWRFCCLWGFLDGCGAGVTRWRDGEKEWR